MDENLIAFKKFDSDHCKDLQLPVLQKLHSNYNLLLAGSQLLQLFQCNVWK